MVIRLEGKLGGQLVIFDHIEGDRWEATVPPDLYGEYVLELVATDSAGNKGFAAKYLLTIDLSGLCVHLRPYPYIVKAKRTYTAKWRVSPYYVKPVTQECGCGGGCHGNDPV